MEDILIQSEPHALLVKSLLGNVGACAGVLQLDDIARYDSQEHKDDNRDGKESGDDEEESRENVALHCGSAAGSEWRRGCLCSVSYGDL